MAFPTRDLSVYTLVSVESWNYSSMDTEGNYILKKKHCVKRFQTGWHQGGRQSERGVAIVICCGLEFTPNLLGDRRPRTGQLVLLLGHPQGAPHSKWHFINERTGTIEVKGEFVYANRALVWAYRS